MVHGPEKLTLKCLYSHHLGGYNASLNEPYEIFQIDFDKKEVYWETDGKFRKTETSYLDSFEFDNETIKFKLYVEYLPKQPYVYTINRTSGTLEIRKLDKRTDNERLESWNKYYKDDKQINWDKEKLLRPNTWTAYFECEKLEKKF